MKRTAFLPILLYLSSCSMESKHSLLKEPAKSVYEVGQIWSYNTRPSEPEAKLTIVKIDGQDSLGNIVHVHISNVKVKTSSNPDRYSENISHMPFSEAALDSSVTKQVGTATKLPDFNEGYNQWRQGFESGHAGVFSITVGEAVTFIEKATLQGQ